MIQLLRLIKEIPKDRRKKAISVLQDLINQTPAKDE